MLSVARFRKHFPEFSETPGELISAKISVAESFTSSDAFPESQREYAVMLCAADLLALQPDGEQARLRAENRATIYGTLLAQIRRAAVACFRRVS